MLSNLDHQPQQHVVESQRGRLEVTSATPGLSDNLGVQPDPDITQDQSYAYKQQLQDGVATIGLDFGLMHLAIRCFNPKTDVKASFIIG